MLLPRRQRQLSSSTARRVRVVLAVLALLALFGQTLAPLARAQAQPLAVEEIAAGLKATFGLAVTLCVHVDDVGPAQRHASHGCDDGCPLCAAHALAPPQTPVFAEPYPLTTRLARPLPPDAAPPPARASPAQPRAPPASI